MPRGRTNPKPSKAPKPAAPRTTTRPAAPKFVPAPKPTVTATRVTLRAPNTRATNTIVTKAINARKNAKK